MQLVLKDARGIGHGVHWRDRAVRLDLEDQLVIVQRLALTGRLDAIGDALDRRIQGVDGDQTDRGVFRTVQLGGDIALAVLDGQFHAHRGTLVQRADHVVRVQHLDVRRDVDLAGGYGTGARGAQGHALGAFSVHAQRQLLDVQHDVDDVFPHAFQRREFVNDAVDLDRGHGRALQRRQENAAQGIAERHAEAAFQGLGDQARLALRVGARLDLRLLGTDQLLPVTFDHVCPSKTERRSLAPRQGRQDTGGVR